MARSVTNGHPRERPVAHQQPPTCAAVDAVTGAQRPFRRSMIRGWHHGRGLFSYCSVLLSHGSAEQTLTSTWTTKWVPDQLWYGRGQSRRPLRDQSGRLSATALTGVLGLVGPLPPAGYSPHGVAHEPSERGLAVPAEQERLRRYRNADGAAYRAGIGA